MVNEPQFMLLLGLVLGFVIGLAVCGLGVLVSWTRARPPEARTGPKAFRIRT